jgi:aspartate/methionine/tyrosine aminotransferase
MTVSRLSGIPGIGVNEIGDAADAAGDPELLRLENLDTDLRPPDVALDATRLAVDDDAANSYLPFQGHRALREAAARYVGSADGRAYDPDTQCVSVAGGLNGVLNTLLAVVEPGQEVVLCDPVYAGLVNRVRLAGGVPRFVRSVPGPGGWTTDPADLAAAIGPATAAVLTLSPSMPTGGLLGSAHWDAMAEAVARHRPWIVHDAAMERIRFDGRAPDGPAGHPVLGERTITVGSASKELRMIGWRVGWVVGPASIVRDITLVGLTNVVCQVGIAQQAVAAALASRSVLDDVAAATRTWQERRDVVLRELHDYPCVRPDGGWSLLVDVEELGLTAAEASRRLFERGRIAATPMTDWGPSGARYVRLVYANETVERLVGLRSRVAAAFS